MEKKVVIQAPPPNLYPTTDGFIESEFDVFIYQKGYDVILEQALECPCKSTRTSQLSDCQNCGGIGWLFISPIETRMLLKSMNENTSIKTWSTENLGNVNISSMSKNKLCNMDKITLYKNIATFNEVRHFKLSQNNQLFTYCSYNIKKIKYVGLFVDSTHPLTRLVEGVDYTFDGNKIFLDTKYNSAYVDDNTYSITVRYLHYPQYYVIDLPRQVISSRKTFEGKEEFQDDLPVSAIGRRAHYVLDASNIATARFLDNSYIDDECGKTIKIVDSYSKLC
jgi:hypothetical protein